MNIRDIHYETARQFSEIAASQRWVEERMVEIRDTLKRQQRRFEQTLRALGIVIEEKKKKPHKIKFRTVKAVARKQIPAPRKPPKKAPLGTK